MPSRIYSMIAILCLLAAGSVSVVWHVVVEGSPIPFWAWGFMAGVLFALPPLRNGLPGSPPLGSLVDWAAFYWAILVVGRVQQLPSGAG